jgi:hypothetical protein
VIFAVCPRLFTDFMGVSWAVGGGRTPPLRAGGGRPHDDRKSAV